MICTYCFEEVEQVNEKKHCAPCVKLIKGYLEQFTAGKTASELDYLYTLEDLKEYASLYNIKGRSKLNKLQLAMAVEDAACNMFQMAGRP